MPQIKAYRGYYVATGEIVDLIEELLTDAANRRAKIAIIGNPDVHKLDGAVASLRAIKEAMYNLEHYGDLIPQPDPAEKEVEEHAKAVESDSKLVDGTGAPLKKSTEV